VTIKFARSLATLTGGSLPIHREGNAASTDATKDARHSASPELVVAQC
jgi:hypothetical protein